MSPYTAILQFLHIHIILRMANAEAPISAQVRMRNTAGPQTARESRHGALARPINAAYGGPIRWGAVCA